MKRKLGYCVIGVTMFLFIGCNKTTKEDAGATSAVVATPASIVEETTTPEETSSAEEKGYKEALSDEELSEVERLAKEYYETCSFDLLSIKVAEDDYSGYTYQSEYEPGNIIIFLAETTHAGEGVYRQITFARKDKNSQWERINEGY